MSSKINIAILDDDSLFVDGIAALIKNKNDFNVSYKTTNPITFLDFISKTTELPDVVLLDLNMKPINGIEVLDELLKQKIDLKIIVLSSLYNSVMYGYMIKYGISAFLPKSCEKEELFTAIKEVFKNNFFLNKNNQVLVDSYLESYKKNQKIWNKPTLSERETEVLIAICEELSTKEIAHKLSISTKTVESHRSKIMEKIDCKNAIGMVIYAILNGIFIIKH